MDNYKIKWKVSEPPSGKYRSFEPRGWPSAYFIDKEQNPAGYILCEDEYIPKNVKTGNHRTLALYVADYSKSNAETGRFVWRKAKKYFTTLQEAKEALDRIYKKYPEILPIHLR